MNSRVITAIVALPILIAAIILPYLVPQFAASTWLFQLIAVFALGAGLFEYFSLTKKLELKGDASVAYLVSAALFVAFLFDAPSKLPDMLLMTLVAGTILLLVTQTFRFQVDFSKMLTGVGVTLLGIIYVAFLGGYIVAIRGGFTESIVPYLSTKLLGFFFLAVMGADTGAYYVGKNFGKHKLAPKVSPGKTWEGVAGGLLLSAGFAAIASATFFPELPFAVSIPLACAMSVVGLFGDLAESAMKRGAGAKDAANILPGHGGLLDRLDSLLFNAPILYYFARLYF